MRKAIKQELMENIPEIENRVFELHETSAETQKPYIVLIKGIESKDSLWTGFKQTFEVFLYVNKDTFSSIDQLTKKVVTVLNKQQLQTEEAMPFTCIYNGSVSKDTADKEKNAISRGLVFSIMALQPDENKLDIQSDPFIETIAKWTETKYHDLHVYRQIWPVEYIRPAVLWRVAEDRFEAINSRSVWRYADVIGHVIGRTTNEQNKIVSDTIRKLELLVKIPQDIGYLTIINSNTNLSVDGFKEGQIKLTLRGKVKEEKENKPIMNSIYTNGTWR